MSFIDLVTNIYKIFEYFSRPNKKSKAKYCYKQFKYRWAKFFNDTINQFTTVFLF